MPKKKLIVQLSESSDEEPVVKLKKKSSESDSDDDSNNISWNPSQNDKKWTKVTSEKDSNLIYYKYSDIPVIDVDLSNFINDANKRIEKLKNGTYKKKDYAESDVNIYKVIKYYDDYTSFISYTTQLIEDNILNMLVQQISNKTKKSQMDIFLDINDVKCKLVGCYKGKLSKAELDIIKLNHSDSQKQTKKVLDVKKLITLYENIMKKFISDETKCTLKNKKYYIHRIFKKTDSKLQYILGSFEKLRNKDIDTIIQKYKLNFDKGLIEIELLCQFDCKLECEGLLKVDEYIYKYKSLEGMNRFYNVINCEYIEKDISEIKKDVFLFVQKYIMMNTLQENIVDKTKGYIASIKNKDKIYLFSGMSSIKSRLEYFYSIEKCHVQKYEEIVNTLNSVSFLELKIEVLEEGIDEMDLDAKLLYYMNRMKLFVSDKQVKPKSLFKTFHAVTNSKYYKKKFSKN